jgi:lipopolysaccharide transport system permease protein
MMSGSYVTVRPSRCGGGGDAGGKIGRSVQMNSVPTWSYTRSLRIEAQRSWRMPDFAEIWRYRELLYFFVWRDIKVRYKQTVLGGLWAILQPLTTTALFTIVFGRLGGMSKHVEGPYALHVFVALLPWTFFANAVAAAANSLVGSSHLISKVYFPRVLVPIASIASGGVDFAISFVALLVLLAIYGVSPSWTFLTLPLFIVGTCAAAIGVGLLFAALIVTFRDFRYVAAFVLQLWLYATPVLYVLDIVPPAWRLAYAVNPMVGMVSGFRAAVLGGLFARDVIVTSFVTAAVMLAAGTAYFLQVERRFADVI